MKTRIFIAWVLCVLGATAFAETKTEPPVPVRTVAPEYPDELKRDRVAGVVLVKIEIDAQGNVVSVAVQKSSNQAFEQPALEALKKWRFKPAQQNGNPVPAKLNVPIKFNAES
jgi:protein TonB